MPENQLSLFDFDSLTEADGRRNHLYIGSVEADHNRPTSASPLPSPATTTPLTPTPATSVFESSDTTSASFVSETSSVSEAYEYLLSKNPNEECTDISNFQNEALILSSCNHDKIARPYQEAGIKWALQFDSDAYESKSTTPRGRIAVAICDQMRLGKTPQALLVAKNLLVTKKVSKILIVVRSANLYQWVKEYHTWVNPLPTAIWPITSSKSYLPTVFQAYIISMDTVNSCKEQLVSLNFDLAIIDEAHFLKDIEAQRTTAIRELLKSVANVIWLTGTPVKNRASEYFTILNSCDPTNFPSLHSYKYNWLEQDSKGRYSRLKENRVEEFRKLTASYILRREKEDVYSTLPTFSKNYILVSMDEKVLKDLYNKELDKMNERIENAGGKITARTVSDSLIVLRRICGIAKVKPTLEYIEEFISESEPTEKLAIGIHHKDVMETLKLKIPKRYGVVTLTGSDSAAQKFKVMDYEMKKEENRILLISQLAGGVGMDFHYIDYVLNTERQWNPADEEQFDFRFYNPDMSIKTRPTNSDTFIAKGTIDEFWHKMVIEKKIVLNETYENLEFNEEEAFNFKNLVEETLQNRL